MDLFIGSVHVAQRSFITGSKTAASPYQEVVKGMNVIMKITCMIMILLSYCYWSVDSCGRGRGRTSVGVTGQARRNYGRIHGTVTHEWDRGSAHVGGGVDTNGNWGVEAGVEFRFRKRSVQSHYNITLKVDPCNFYTYDDDRDGTIVKEELHAIFGNNEKTNALFKDLDITPGDGYIAEEEFYAMAPVIIAECLDTDEW
ncbi:uncharacterized protein LOC123545149 [Mercenaria mercenaria]|uniref:uncharacterized protein LOC123545149 n=1 Tax=Mercenaria mercenaria TaxID=6596 RepID=UPI00234F1D74|nr:uncharacterized protein LOC123545149 [Mercenaria mercenaria]